jgi:hypothetical protein
LHRSGQQQNHDPELGHGQRDRQYRLRALDQHVIEHLRWRERQSEAEQKREAKLRRMG